MARSLLLLQAASASLLATSAAGASSHRWRGGISVSFGEGADAGVLVAEVASSSSFRLGVRFSGWGTPALESTSLDPTPPAPSSPVSWGGMTGLQTSFGSLLVAGDGSGRWALYDTSNNTLVSSGGPPTQNANTSSSDGGIVLPVSGTAAGNGPSRQSNCLGNGNFGPPFYYNRDGAYLAFSVSSWFYDPVQPHCYPTDFSGVIGRHGVRDTCQPQRTGTDVTDPVRSDGFPDGLKNQTEAGCCAACNGDASCIAWVWSDGSNPDPAGDCWPLKGFGSTTPKPGRVTGGALPPPPQEAWWAMGGAADWYLAPAPAPLAFYRALYELTGTPGVPPLYAMGFMTTYWGYESMEYVEGNMTAFRDGEYPVDLFIMDYDWWNPSGSYNDAKDLDFGYDPVMFGPHSFVHPPGSSVPNATTNGSVSLFDHFHNDINMKFGGIRKPRTYSNKALSNASGWLLPDDFNVGAGPNNWNMTVAGWAPWFSNRSQHFISEGLDMWWNDEGETQWFTYSWWNLAQAAEQEAAAPGKRFWTINRSYQPGMQKHPAISWTGDGQDCSHAKALSFTTAGQLYTACDMTSPTATVLVRQYQNAVFLPIMRVHQMHGTPRFPWLWGGAQHQAAFRAALQLRYHFLPHLYSLAHAARAALAPVAMPASYVFPDAAPDFPPAAGDAVYMVGDSLLPAVVSTSHNDDPNENTTTSVLPPGTWFAFNSTAAQPGLQTITYTDVPLDQVVLFVRAGGILTLQRDVIQHTGQAGGVLELHVYAGRDGAFTFTEDDGATTAYQASLDAATRRTAFVWTDATRTLSWTVAGSYAGPQLYATAAPVLFVANASGPVYHAPVALGAAGSISF